MSAEARTTPTIGQPLPRACDAYSPPEKWGGWIFAPLGHGTEWARVFHAGIAVSERVWSAIGKAILQAPVHKIIDHGQQGVVCGVDIDLTLGSRSARVRTSWHYEHPGAAPRLVTAYPRL